MKPTWKALLWDPPWTLWDFHRKTLFSGAFSSPLKLSLMGIHMGFSRSWALVHVPAVSPHSPPRPQRFLLPHAAKAQEANIEMGARGACYQYTEK